MLGPGAETGAEQGTGAHRKTAIHVPWVPVLEPAPSVTAAASWCAHRGHRQHRCHRSVEMSQCLRPRPPVSERVQSCEAPATFGSHSRSLTSQNLCPWIPLCLTLLLTVFPG